MAKTVKIPTAAGWVYIEDDGSVVEIASPAAAPEGATLFRLKPIPVDASLYMAMATNAKERTEAIALSMRGTIAEVRNLTDDDGNDVPFSPDLLDAIPLDVLIALGNHVTAKRMDKAKDEAAARRGKGSGTSPTKKRSSGAATTGSRTALRATS